MKDSVDKARATFLEEQNKTLKEFLKELSAGLARCGLPLNQQEAIMIGDGLSLEDAQKTMQETMEEIGSICKALNDIDFNDVDHPVEFAADESRGIIKTDKHFFIFSELCFAFSFAF